MLSLYLFNLFKYTKDLLSKLSMNNQKIYYSKQICDKLKAIDMRNEDKSKQFILKDLLEKKSDKGITWEK